MATVVCKIDPYYLPDDTNVSCASTTSSAVSQLSTGEESKVLSALSTPSLSNVIMSGFICDNGLDSPLNRGCFYACHDEQKTLTGIALIGHTTLLEAFDEGAMQAFANVARETPTKHLLIGEHNAVLQFWNEYAVNGESPRLIHPILFLQRCEQFNQYEPVDGLRLATKKDLEHVVRAQAAMAFETSGVDPLKKDPAGFRERYLRRIEKERVWVLMKDDQLVFKTDVTSESEDVAYLEGVYVSPEERGKGLGRICLQAIGHILLQRKKAIYLFVEHDNARLQSFYFNLGFSLGGYYDLLYF
ncbi:MAG TPA: GNAT family N-acetyltransferase [Pyrinomonadaceae bacterium]|nr:GNAT family N-acetyltransferase [Pyrinomonadaceae bacterium]